MNTLYLIPARGGSKGILKKNIKLLNEKPLIYYSIETAREVANDIDICVSSDCDEIISVVEDCGLNVHFKRPDHLSGDSAGTNDVLLHALNFYASKGKHYDNIMLLQPTSPFRRKQQIEEVIGLYDSQIDMVVSVALCHHSPYFSLFEENEMGFLEKSKDGYFETRQEAPKVYNYNGSLYLINARSLMQMPIHKFQKVRKYIMDDVHSVDIDSPLDWAICETIIREGYLK